MRARVCVRTRRVQTTVKDSLAKHTLDIVQLNLDLTPAMQRIQDVILKMIDQCLQQLKQTNRVPHDTIDDAG